ncbi:unnamed protein product [Cyclocybe aegerita]|uniref:Uncharacterized protein n=1 Tax=Cyclocybe aegerita TaxID=1973307 RepID=A0A8S0W086_CYCAE|nr:unnamed protein product [Cyclocybe aegerita]
MSRQMATKIILSLHAPPRILTVSCTERTLRKKKFVAGGRRVLTIDLSSVPICFLEDRHAQFYKLDCDESHYGNPKKGDGIYARPLEPFEDPANQAANGRLERLRTEHLMRDLRRVVSDDLRAPAEERIDTVEIGPEPPSEVLKALDGLCPNHLRSWAAWEEEIRLHSLTTIKNRWTNLESLYLIGECTGWYPDSPNIIDGKYLPDYPKIITQIEALTMRYCLGFRFDGDILPMKFKRFKIINNDVMDTFIYACMNIPGFADRLETLHIASNGGCDFNDHDLDTFHKHLIKCSNLRDLTLILGGPDQTDIGMAPFIPKSVEYLAFHCSTSDEMLEDLDTWVACAADPTWAPWLKVFAVNTDAMKRHISAFDVKLQGDVDPPKVSEFEHKLDVICKALKSRVPPVEIFI